MDQSNTKANVNSIALIGTILIGLYCLLSSIYYRSFAHLHIQIPHLNFPIFIGEILLFVCICLVFLKWKVEKKVFTRNHFIILAFVVWFLGKAALGFIEHGAHSFRNAALFYYSLFALLGYEFFQKKYFSQANMIIILVILLVSKWALGINNYYVFPYLCLSLLLISKIKNIWIKLLAIVPTIVTPIHTFTELRLSLAFFFQGGRARVLGHIVGFTAMAASFGIGKLRNKKMVIGIVLVTLFLSGIGISKYADKHALISMTSLDEIKEQYHELNKTIKEREEHYEPEEIPVSLYSKEEKGMMTDVKRQMRRLDPNKRGEELKTYQSIQEKLLELKKEEEGDIEQMFAKLAHQKKEEIDSFLNSNEYKNMTEFQRKKFIALIEAQYHDKSRLARLAIIEETKKVIDETLQKYGKKDELALGNIESLTTTPGKHRNLRTAYNTIFFRLFIWKDMVVEVLEEKAVFGVSFGKPQRSKSIEILQWASMAWGKDGWITPHNSWLHYFYRGGIVGIIFIATFLVVAFRLLVKLIQRKSFLGVMLISIFAYWTTIAFFLVFLEFPYAAIQFWTLFGMTIRYCQES